jgi:hypothetical protein
MMSLLPYSNNGIKVFLWITRSTPALLKNSLIPFLEYGKGHKNESDQLLEV